MNEPVHEHLSRAAFRVARLLHRADFGYLLPQLARLPVGLGHVLSNARGYLNAATGRDWRSMGLGRLRHIEKQSELGYGLLDTTATPNKVRQWCTQRFVAEARDEFEAQLVAARRVGELSCEMIPAEGLQLLQGRQRGLVLLTPHFESFFLGVAFLARSGVKVNLMSSAITHDPRVDAEIQRHFTAKYRGLEHYLNGGKVVDLELGTRQFYRMLQNGEVLVILGDAPVMPEGVSMEVDFLGGRRVLSGGPLRLARHTGSDLGGYVCRHLGGTRYQLEFSPVGLAQEPATVANVYRFLSAKIQANPGGWWGADLLPNMPLAQETRGASAEADAAPPASATSTPLASASPASASPASASPALDAGGGAAGVAFQTLVLTDSMLAGSDELACGLRRLRNALAAADNTGWREAASAEVQPADFLRGCSERFLLVLTQPALIVTESLPRELAACLTSGDAACAVAADQRGAQGEWAVSYTSLVDFERYVARRQGLAAAAPWNGAAPWAYMIDVAAALQAVNDNLGLRWADLPAALGRRTVMAARAFVHSYADYQQGAREEMLDLLPTTVHRLLDVGGGEGRFARAFIKARGGEALLIEPSAAATQAQADSHLNVMRGRLEDADPAQTGLFDAVSFLDVLEHMTDPLSALMTARRFLKPGGLLLVSVPNAGHWSVVRDLALGRFDYMPVGILCATHLRFFTASSLAQLLGDAGFQPVQWRRTGPPMPEEFERFLGASAQAQLAWDRESLQTESLHVLAALH
jgi:lauroyl/myristoyl acyltransferase/SAM-dependent methyltransferase